MPRANEGLIRVEIKLAEEDRELLIMHYGQGWTTRIRELVAEHCQEIKGGHAVDLLTAGDLIDD